MDIAKRWSLLKQAILTDKSIQNSDLPDAYRRVFKDLDADLSGKLGKASAAAEKAAKKEDPASRAALKAALLEAASVIADYQAHLGWIEDAFLAKYNANASWAVLRTNLTRIQDDALAAAARLP